MPALRVLVLGGTGEARALAAALHARGHEVTSSLAGRTARPAVPDGGVRTGGFGGAAGLAAWLREHSVDALVDATHPFAARMTAHAVAAAAEVGVPLVVLRRRGWTECPGDRWHRVPDAAAAAVLLPRLGERVLLATGSGDLAAFAACEGWFLVRAVDPPGPPLPARHEVLLARGPFGLAGERALLDAHRVDVVVTRDSGGAATVAKLVAARERGLPVVVIDRPPAPDAAVVATVEEALAVLHA